MALSRSHPLGCCSVPPDLLLYSFVELDFSEPGLWYEPYLFRARVSKRGKTDEPLDGQVSAHKRPLLRRPSRTVLLLGDGSGSQFHCDKNHKYLLHIGTGWQRSGRGSLPSPILDNTGAALLPGQSASGPTQEGRTLLIVAKGAARPSQSR